MHYFIDGYNLMFRVLRAGDDLQKQRLLIIRDLSHKIQTLSLNVTLVFDAQYYKGESSRTHREPLDIRFTEQGETADEFILQQLKHDDNPRQQTVVTSDKKLAWLARRRGAHTESVEEFFKWLNHRYRNKLRHSKVVSPSLAIPEKQKNVISIPTKTPAEESFEYYLKHFEANLQELPQDNAKTQVTKKKKVDNSKNIQQNDEGLSDMERWRRAFESELDSEAN